MLRSAGFSPKFKKVVGIAMIDKNYCDSGQKFQTLISDKEVLGEVCSLPIQ